jgi:dienelactone hydrolase
MAVVLLFHHAQGQTPGFFEFAEQLRGAGHSVSTPDLFGDGRTFETLEEGLAFAEEVGFEQLVERGVAAAEGLPDRMVYAGFSLGVMPAQKLAQTRPGAAGALFFDSCVPTSFFGEWPVGLRAQVHGMEADPIFANEGDLEAARSLSESEPGVDLFLYPGDQHIFADRSLPSYREDAAALLLERSKSFLASID